jgi:hypothetical protein
MDAPQRAVPVPRREIMMGGALGRQILWQRLPLAARRKYVKDRVENLAQVHATRSSCLRALRHPQMADFYSAPAAGFYSAVDSSVSRGAIATYSDPTELRCRCWRVTRR